jgi:endo-1,4-beta-D-glucanase Y
VSEGIAYGMLATLYMGDQVVFDGLWTYAKAHLDANGLMNWHITSGGTTAGDGAGSAADADLDMAWALLGAAQQWGSATYLADGKTLIDKIYTYEIAADGMLKPGDGWGNTMETYPDYFSPAYFRLFGQVSGNPYWTTTIMDRNYEILKNSEGAQGLVPDKTTRTYQPPTGTYYAYDACRTPWRIAMDYCFNGEARAKSYLDKVGAFFNGVGAANIVDGYELNGTARGNVHNMAFIGPAGVAGMAGFPKLLDDAFTFGVSGGGDASYFPQSLRVLTMQMMSGNFIDFTK